MSIKKDKQEFVLSELWKSAIGATMSRNPIYLTTATTKQKEDFKSELRRDLKSTLEHAAKINAQPSMTEERLIEIITNTARKYSKKYKAILVNGRFRIGSVQKLVNLYLKYLWTAGNGDEPPHCPFDREILSKLSSVHTVPSWTQMNSIAEYKKWVKKAQEKATAQTYSIAEWELTTYNKIMNKNSTPAQTK